MAQKSTRVTPLVIFSAVAVLVVLLDQLTKHFVKSNTPDWNVGILTIHYVTNTGAGFGILRTQTHWLTLISAAVALVVLFYYPQIEKETIPQALLGLFLGGVVGNFIDRLLLGHVVDFIDFRIWPAFNVADAAITISVIGLVWYYWGK